MGTKVQTLLAAVDSRDQDADSIGHFKAAMAASDGFEDRFDGSYFY